MTSTETRALIEEARGWHDPSHRTYLSELTGRLADALEASEAQRQELAAKIEALVAVAKSRRTRCYGGGYTPGFVQESELRGLVSGDNKEQE